MKKKIFSLLFISFFLLLPFSVKADDGYYIDNYDVDIIVNDNHTLSVTETIDVTFKEDRHGIIRKIPLKNSYTRKYNDKNFTFEQKGYIYDLKVNEKYELKETYSDYEIKIGDPDKYASSNTIYIISYTYDMGDDEVPIYDDLYFNIIGTGWDTYINNVNFSISMPKDFDHSLVNITSGYKNNTNYKDAEYTIENNIIRGYLKNKYDGHALNAYEGLTVRIELPEGYFVNETSIPVNKGCNNYNGYYIDDYDVTLDVKENHVIYVTEKIKVYYTNSLKHGIKRFIPYNNKYYRKVDGEQVVTNEKSIIKKISVDSKYTKTKEDGNYILTIGDKNTYVKTDTPYTYTISYIYDAGDDLIDEYDDLYFNIIGTNWDTYISNVKFKIIMPKEFDVFRK